MTPLKSCALPIALLALTVQAVSARLDVKVDFDKSFNFTAVRTWGWHADGPGEVKMARTQTDNPEGMNKFAAPPLIDAVTTEMKRIGLPQAQSDPDLAVHYFLLLTTNMSTQSMGQFLDGTVAWGLPLFPQATTSLKVLNQGSLVLDLSAKGRVVWRGVAQAQLKPDTDIKKREALLREGVRDLLKRYPPKP
jgi:hypothetical protein